MRKNHLESTIENKPVKWLILFTVTCLATAQPLYLKAQTCTFTSKILASNNPFASCPIGTDTIIIMDTLEMDIDYEPMPGNGGIPFEGVLLVDGGVIYWSSPVKLKLGTNACIQLRDNGHLYPNDVNDVACDQLKTIYFDFIKVASCSGQNAPSSFSDVNLANCLGCCDSTSAVTEASDLPINLNLHIFPNPTSGNMLLTFKLQSRQAYRLVIYEPSGKVLLKQDGLGSAGWNKVPVALGSVSAGVYLLELYADHLKAIKQLIVGE